jgi:hypothetical protein
VGIWTTGWQQGINRLTRGATVASVNFSDGVLRALAGNAGVNPAPELVAALFGQLFSAGANIQGALPLVEKVRRRRTSTGVSPPTSS